MNEQRPRQVTVAGWLIILGGIAVVVTAYQQMAALHSLATRQWVQSMLADPALQGTGVGVGAVLTVLHVLALVSGACAAASVVLGWHALHGSRSARVVVSVLAVPLLLAGLGGGGLFSTVVAVAALLLWMPPARQWFAGEQVLGPSGPAAPHDRGADPRRVPPSSPLPPRSQTPPGQPPVPPGSPGSPGPMPPGQPPVGWGPPPGHQMPPQLAWPPPPWAQRQRVPWPYPMPPRLERRPGGVVASAVLTWVFSAVAALVMLGMVAYAVSDSASIWRTALQENSSLPSEGMTQGLFVAFLYLTAGLVVLWCVATTVVSIFVWRGASWARVTLLVLVSVSLAVLVVASIVNVVFLLPAAAAMVTVVLLARPEARAWCQPRRR